MAHWITDYYDGTFNSVGFWQQGPRQGFNIAAAPLRAQVQWIHYPFSDANTRVSAGKLHKELSLVVAATLANLDSLEALVDSSHNLSWFGGFHSAYLDSTQDRLDMYSEGVGLITLNFSWQP